MGRIVVIEDVQDNFDLIADALGEAHELLHATTGSDGLALVRQEIPDLVLLDIGLPGVNGWDVVRQLKADPLSTAIPVIAMTAHAMKGDREKCIEMGCDEYLSKPIEIRQLRELVEDRIKTVQPSDCV